MNVYRWLADLLVVVHFGYVIFVLVGLLLILVGILRRWRWVRNFWFRVVHFVMIAVVALESISRITCPLTTWEQRLRVASGQGSAGGSFIGRWVHRLLFIDAPDVVLTTGYCLFALIVFFAFVFAPPNWPSRTGGGQSP